MDDVAVTLGGSAVIRSASLALAPGSRTALLGPSGCGKTTLLRVVAGLLGADRGDVRLDGRSLTAIPAERRPVGLVFQRPLLFPQLTVAGNVAFGLRVRRTPRREVRDRVAAMLERVQLTGLADRRVGQLSGGQEQRVALARALVLAPRLLLLDEPFSQLDAPLRLQMRALVRDLVSGSQVTTVFVTHDLAEAVDLGGDIALMMDGRIAGHAPAERFFTRPPSLAAARFLGAANELPGHVRDGRFQGGPGRDVPAAGVPDGPAVLVVRPESWRPVAGPGGVPGGITATGTVVAARFAGSHLAAELRLPDGTSLAAQLPLGTSVEVGRVLELGADPAAGTVFAGSPTVTGGG
ncbi:ABC transporter ATP-binding protein [Nakamurella endophytica]|uniref:ABC transporter ATP-binding protein n=1 Tax=Nakamurella endophytica TaxID=1748367 RepID=UPI001664D122|nr:ABC transporter ATP-binding protein [Nakamurella endophytica]